MTALEFHRRAVLSRESLQQLGGTRVEMVAAPSIGVQQGDMTAVSLFELVQFATGTQLQPPVQIEKISLVGQIVPLAPRPSAARWPDSGRCRSARLLPLRLRFDPLAGVKDRQYSRTAKSFASTFSA